MSALVHDVREVVAEFPGDWHDEGVGNALKFPGGVLRVGPQGTSRCYGFLSIGVYVVLDRDRVPGIASTNIAFLRALENDGTTTSQGPPSYLFRTTFPSDIGLGDLHSTAILVNRIEHGAPVPERHIYAENLTKYHPAGGCEATARKYAEVLAKRNAA